MLAHLIGKHFDEAGQVSADALVSAVRAALGEVMGTCRLRRGTGLAEMPGLLVELADAAGRVVQSQRSAYDGFFDFLGIPAGAYLLRVAPDSLSPVGLRASPPRFVVVTPSGTPVDGLDFTLEAAASSPQGGAR